LSYRARAFPIWSFVCLLTYQALSQPIFVPIFERPPLFYLVLEKNQYLSYLLSIWTANFYVPTNFCIINNLKKEEYLLQQILYLTLAIEIASQIRDASAAAAA
jgi:hypothetical protein